MRMRGPCAEGVAQGRDHVLVRAVVDSDLEVEDVVPGRQSVLHLRAQLVVVAAREVREVRHVVAQRAAQEPPERLAHGLAADVGQRHVDAGPGEVARPGEELPEPEAERVGPHGIAIPGIASDHEGRHGPDGGLDRSGIGAARGLAPPDEPVVGRDRARGCR